MDEASQKLIDDLSKRIGDLERTVYKWTVAAIAAGIVVGLLFGITLIQLPQAARHAANERLPELVEAEAKKQLPDAVKMEAANELPGIVAKAAASTLPDLVRARADSVIPEMKSEMTKQLTTIIAEKSADVDRARKYMLDQYSEVLGEAAKARTELVQVRQRTIQNEKETRDIEGQITGLTADATRLGGLLKGIESSKEVDIAKVIEQLNKAPEAKELLDEVRDVKNQVARISGLTVRFGTPITVAYGSKEKKELYTAPSAGFIILTNAGSGVGSAEGGIEGPNSRVFYELVPGTILGERGVSHMLPAGKGDRFAVWGTQKTIRIYFIPIESEIPPNSK